MPIFFLSGALYPLTNLPAVLEAITRVDPLSYGVDALRTILIDRSVFGLTLDLAVLLSVTVVFLAIGSKLFSKIEV
jgi:ABC-2 type transport system permease protein